MTSDDLGNNNEDRDLATLPSDLPELPTINLLAGNFGRVTTVPFTNMSLVTSVGHLDDGTDILVPLVETVIASTESDDEAESKIAFAELLTFENAAFLISDMAGDFQVVCSHLGDIAAGRLLPEPVRLEHARQYMLEAEARVRACLSELERLTSVPPRHVLREE